MKDPYQDLTNAIILMAVKDYRNALKKLKKRPCHGPATEMKNEVERFFRSDWYRDLTSVDGETLIKKLQAEMERKYPYKPLVYICSPYRGDIETNTQRAREFSRFALDEGNIPLAPHLLFPQFMDDDDPEERELAILMNIVLLGKCREVWVLGSDITEGMAYEIQQAKIKKRPVRYFDQDFKEVALKMEGALE